MVSSSLRTHKMSRTAMGLGSAPDASWFRGESIEFVRRTLLGPKARIYDFLDRTTIERLIRDHLDGRENRRLLIWSLLSFEQWCRTFLEGERGRLS